MWVALHTSRMCCNFKDITLLKRKEYNNQINKYHSQTDKFLLSDQDISYFIKTTKKSSSVLSCCSRTAHMEKGSVRIITQDQVPRPSKSGFGRT